jgi:hypothetical protein
MSRFSCANLPLNRTEPITGLNLNGSIEKYRLVILFTVECAQLQKRQPSFKGFNENSADIIFSNSKFCHIVSF